MNLPASVPAGENIPGGNPSGNSVPADDPFATPNGAPLVLDMSKIPDPSDIGAGDVW